MTLRVLLFAQLADSIGRRSIDIELPDGSTVADLLRALENERASIATLRGRIAVAVDECYATAETVLREGQTIALIPPVSGG